MHYEFRTTEAASKCGVTDRTSATRAPRRWKAALTCACLAVTIASVGCATSPQGKPETSLASEARHTIDTFALLVEAADHEALYTLVGGLKPMSTGIWRGSFVVADPALAELRGVRAALAPLRNDIWYADVQVFENIHDGERAAHAFVVHRRAFSRMIDRYAEFWSPWGITPCTNPSEVVAVVDRMPRADRWWGYGYLFGYPS